MTGQNSSGRARTWMSARDWILASATVVMLVFSSHAGLAQRRDWIAPRLDLEVPEDGLDDPTGYDDLQFFSDRLWWTGCQTRICSIWFTIAELYYDSHMGRGPQGSECMPGLRECPGRIRVISQRLDGKINAHPAWRPSSVLPLPPWRSATMARRRRRIQISAPIRSTSRAR